SMHSLSKTCPQRPWIGRKALCFSKQAGPERRCALRQLYRAFKPAWPHAGSMDAFGPAEQAAKKEETA
ncbi:MAG TPA: hypothetical protein VE084_24460, partial [Burkholderiaceae bacterium]|nr:hypothetical protein [Burkholderiaceae bacterium]